MQKAHGILSDTFITDFEVQVVAGGTSGTSHFGDFLAAPHHLTDRYGLNPETAMARFLAAAPRFIIAGRSPEDTIYGAASRMLAAALAKDYKLVGRYSSHWRTDIRVYERK